MCVGRGADHNWVHDNLAKCVRGDDFTKNLSIHHSVIWNCGEPVSDGAGQSFGVVLKGDMGVIPGEGTDFQLL